MAMRINANTQKALANRTNRRSRVRAQKRRKNRPAVACPRKITPFRNELMRSMRSGDMAHSLSGVADQPDIQEHDTEHCSQTGSNQQFNIREHNEIDVEQQIVGGHREETQCAPE